MIQPPFSSRRKNSMEKCFELLNKDKPIILEFGMTRVLDGCEGDGYSTIHWAYQIAQYGGSLISIDIDPQTINVSSALIKFYEISTNNIFLVCADAMSFLDSFELKKIDLLYLDAWDYLGNQEELDKSSKMHLQAFLKCEPMLKSGSLVLIDDILDTQTLIGKGKEVIPYMEIIGYENCYRDYQFLYRKP